MSFVPNNKIINRKDIPSVPHKPVSEYIGNIFEIL
jgi:hypothetical protein